VSPIAEFTDPRLVAIYDTVNAYSPAAQPAFYLQLARELGASSVIDLGCGTGLITRELAREGFEMTGVDPSPFMLDVARSRPHSHRVTWVEGDATTLGYLGADFSMMSGHVAQFFLTDETWLAALRGLHSTLRPGGYLAFESRNPGAREWEGWTRASRNVVEDRVAGRIDCWIEADGIVDGVVRCANHYRFLATGEELVSECQLRFRTMEELSKSLDHAGFSVQSMYGNWDSTPPGSAARELIVVARSI
jgi:SAM-dependent methyltransferase